MSYLVLARKWRPQSLEEVTGQEHIVRTLTYSLDNDRLHHAYLFTGTRGVGKTTLARILAKALNCERGVSSQPCNQCTPCVEISEGRFVDLIEVDAASRTKVDDTRALLDNVHYGAASGSYKVYLIDEIHMLSGHSFNALLKTLEEPPGHVKFLLATTDPQKLPMTILSRCLQFNLRALDIEEIRDQFVKILEAEAIPFEPAALDEIARHARGSMRDGLSILDQAISYTGADLKETLIRDMLGMVSRDMIHDLVKALAEHDVEQTMQKVEAITQSSMNFEVVFDELLLLFHELALFKSAPHVARARKNPNQDFEQLAGAISEEDIQLFYQIALVGKQDLALAPDPVSGFEMTVLRMLSFVPASGLVFDNQTRETVTEPSAGSTVRHAQSPAKSHARETSQTATDSATNSMAAEPIHSAQDWLNFLETTHDLSAPLKVFASGLSFVERTKNNTLKFVLPDNKWTEINDMNVKKLEGRLLKIFGEQIHVNVAVGTSDNESLDEQNQRKTREDEKITQQKLLEARKKIESETIPQLLINELGATIQDVQLAPASQDTNQATEDTR